MKYFDINELFSKELYARFAAFASDNDDENWTISIQSEGGEANYCYMMLHIINGRKDRVTLVLMIAKSAAFEFFYRAECKRVIIPGAWALCHKPYVMTSAHAGGKILFSDHKSQIDNMRSLKDRDFYRKLLGKKDYKRYKKGWDIYFPFKRLKKEFPDATISL